MKYKHTINSEIAIAYITTRKRLTLVAVLGLTLGIAVYIFMNSVLTGFPGKEIVLLIPTAIVIIAGFGIYNMLNRTISQKIGEIAILKAMGFRGRDVVSIFVQQAFIIGLIGMIAGSLAAAFLVWRLPIVFDWTKFAAGIAFCFSITLLAGYIPARKAAKVDPVSIFRK